MEKEIISAVALGIALSASTGFRVFIPMLVASLAARFDILPLSENFLWLESNAAIISFAVATIVEVLAYYIPFVDNALDTIATPLAFGAGSLLMTSVLPIDSELYKWIVGITVGGGLASTIQSGSFFTRLMSSKFTLGTGNSLVATFENIAAFFTSIFSLIFPIIIALIIIISTFFILNKIFRKKVKQKV